MSYLQPNTLSGLFSSGSKDAKDAAKAVAKAQLAAGQMTAYGSLSQAEAERRKSSLLVIGAVVAAALLATGILGWLFSGKQAR